MLYFYKYLEDHPIQNLHYFIEDFFELLHTDNRKRFSLTLLHKEFRSIAKTYEGPLLEPLKKVFNEYKKLEKKEQDKIYNGFKTNNTIETLCKGEGDPLQYEDLSPGIKNALKDLFSNLYGEILKRKEFCDRYGDQKRHYDEFCELNNDAIVCPFCGLMDLPSEYDRYRPAYDHFLPKAIYPFNSVNFLNLVPMCDICNSKFKNQQDILYKQKKKKSRRKVFYPYEATPGEISIEIVVSKQVDDGYTGNYRVEINGPPGKQEELDSWDGIFEIKERYESIFKKRSTSWLEFFKLNYKQWRQRGDNDFSDFVRETCEVLAFQKFEDKAFLKKSFFECLTAEEDFQDNLNATIGT